MESTEKAPSQQIIRCSRILPPHRKNLMTRLVIASPAALAGPAPFRSDSLT